MKCIIIFKLQQNKEKKDESSRFFKTSAIGSSIGSCRCICISQRIGEGVKGDVDCEIFYQMTCKPLFDRDVKLIANKDLSGNKDFIKRFGLRDIIDPKPFTSLSEIEIGLDDFYYDGETVVPIIKGKFSLEDVSRH